MHWSRLAACTAITVRMYAKKKDWELGEFRAESTLTKDANGNAHILRVLHPDATLSDAQCNWLLEIVANTAVTKTMRQGAEITSERGVPAR